MSSHVLRVAAVALALPLALSSCVFAVGREGHKLDASPAAVAVPAEDAAPDAAKAADPKAAEAKALAKARKAAKRAHELDMARRELEVEELDAQSKLRSADVALEHARRELHEAQLEREHFAKHVAPLKLAEASLDFDRATHRKVESEQELHEMEETYAKDQFAKTTKELVLMRHRKDVEFATRSLEIAAQERADLEQVELPREVRERDEKVRAAEDEVRKSEVEKHKAELENAISLAKARFSIHELEQPELEKEGDE
jgi:hypothetical protein